MPGPHMIDKDGPAGRGTAGARRTYAAADGLCPHGVGVVHYHVFDGEVVERLELRSDLAGDLALSP